ncbi:MAG TPA: hypothetical protein VFJ97_07840 [Dermatophilaceae bacterium]|nr:hypothetical protein [Dermatophilaceae bacterium]
MATFPALFDTNVLFGFHLNDVTSGWQSADCEVLVTFNLRDFPEESVAAYDIEIVHPDKLLLDQLDLYPGPTVRVLRQLIDDYSSPTLEMEDQLVRLADAAVPDFARAVRRCL